MIAGEEHPTMGHLLDLFDVGSGESVVHIRSHSQNVVWGEPGNAFHGDLNALTLGKLGLPDRLEDTVFKNGFDRRPHTEKFQLSIRSYILALRNGPSNLRSSTGAAGNPSRGKDFSKPFERVKGFTLVSHFDNPSVGTPLLPRSGLRGSGSLGNRQWSL